MPMITGFSLECLIIVMIVKLSSPAERTTDCDHVDVLFGKPFQLECKTAATAWTHNGEEIFLGRNLISRGFNVNLTENYSLSFREAIIEHEGEYECTGGGVTTSKYCVNVSVVPANLILSADGYNSSEIHVEAGHGSLTLRCSSLKSKPSTSLVWMVGDHMIPPDEVYTKKNENEDLKGTFDSFSVLQYGVEADNVNVTCKTEERWGSVQPEEQISLFTYVTPEIFLFFDNIDVTNETLVTADGGVHTVICHSRGARPNVFLSVEFSGESQLGLRVTTTEIGRGNKSTYDNRVEAPYTVSDNNGTIACVTVGKHGIQDRRVYVQVVVQITNLYSVEDSSSMVTQFQETDADHFPVYVAVAVGLIIVLILLILAYVLIRRRREGSSNEHEVSRGMSVLRTSMKLPSDKAELETEFPAPPNIGDSRVSAYDVPFPKASPTPRRNTSVYVDSTFPVSPPKLDLPKIPVVPDKLTDSYSIEGESVYYSDLKDNVGVGKLFHPHELCILMSMKTGIVHNRWMGSIAVSDKPSKCVFVSTVTDQVLQTRQIQWDIYVKRVLELPQTDSIVKTEGICIDGAKLFLVQEHLTCVTLESHIHSNQRGTDIKASPGFSTSDVKMWTIGLLKGMEVVHSYGLLHPGLCTKKILFNSDKTLKVYDFCLSDDAPRKLMRLKEKMTCTRNQLAPEAILRNEYSSSSDVWSIAVVIWEYLTGSLPFALDVSGTMVRSGRTFQGQWPCEHAEIRCEELFDCWRNDCSTRPSVRQLRLSFEQADGYSMVPPKIEKTTMKTNPTNLDLYVPMKGIATVTSHKSNSY